MILRLFGFILAWSVILLVPGAGIAALGYKVLKPRLLRRRLVKEAQARAKALHGKTVDYYCSICLDPVDIHVDLYQKPFDWHHAACMSRLLNG